MDLVTSELLVLRAWRWDAERLHTDAVRDNLARIADGEADPDFSISVFALAREEGEEIAALKQRLLTRFLEYRSARYVVYATEADLASAGFALRRNEPPPDHYDVAVGLTRDDLRVDDLARVFNANPKEKVPQ